MLSNDADCDSKWISDIAWAYAKARCYDIKLFEVLAREVVRSVSVCGAREVTNTAWAFAKLEHLDLTVFMSLASGAERYLGDFTSQNLASTV